jgi:hypothetical protein
MLKCAFKREDLTQVAALLAPGDATIEGILTVLCYPLDDVVSLGELKTNLETKLLAPNLHNLERCPRQSAGVEYDHLDLVYPRQKQVLEGDIF